MGKIEARSPCLLRSIHTFLLFLAHIHTHICIHIRTHSRSAPVKTKPTGRVTSLDNRGTGTRVPRFWSPFSFSSTASIAGSMRAGVPIGTAYKFRYIRTHASQIFIINIRNVKTRVRAAVRGEERRQTSRARLAAEREGEDRSLLPARRSKDEKEIGIGS